MLSLSTVLLGGIGIFLLGMILLTDGMKAAAGHALRGVLDRFTGTPASALASGAGLAALVQSSSATILTTIGFVSAGLLTFPQAVGVIFGSSLGTTSTGWIVSLLGLRLQVGQLALPLVGVGALMYLLSRGRSSHLGLALAGVGLIFVGIDTLQTGMADLAERIDPAAFPDATFGGTLALLAVGVVMTVVMQSSSAAVATTLTALHAGTLALEQAAVLVVGQNMGTTVKSGLAAIGASVPARRTALAHILFNTTSGVIGLVLLGFLLPFLDGLLGGGSPAVTVAAFHTAFNVLAVALLFPFLAPFCRGLERIVPERTPLITRHLDRSVAELPSVAVEAARRATMEAGELVFQVACHRIREGGETRRGPNPDAGTARRALEEIRRFLGSVQTPPEFPQEYGRHVAVVHASDHLSRLLEALEGPTTAQPQGRDAGGDRSRRTSEVEEVVEDVLGSLEDGMKALARGERNEEAAEWARTIARRTAGTRRQHRARVLEGIARGERSPEEAFTAVDRLRWLDQVGYHAWRVLHHLLGSGPTELTTGRGELEDGPDEAYVEAG